mgnify:CR=1 FL=1
MNRIEIEQCNDIDKLKTLCIEQRKQLGVISEILVDESKWHISSEVAVQKIRDYLVKHQYDLKI